MAYIAALLELNLYEVEIIDCLAEELTIADTLSRIRHSPPDFIGISAVTPNIHVTLKLANRIKDELFFKGPIVFGGAHPTLFPKQILKNKSVDIVVVGEGEYTMLDLAKGLKEGKDLVRVSGIAYKRNGEVVVNPPRMIEKTSIIYHFRRATFFPCIVTSLSFSNGIQSVV